MNVIATLGDDISESRFISKFIEIYSDECGKYDKRYQELKNTGELGKGAPPKLEIYLKNLYNKNKNKQYESALPPTYD